MLNEVKISSYMREWIETHLAHLRDARALAHRKMVMDTIDILVASLIGGVDFLTEPDNRVADILFTTLWYRRVNELAERALRSWLVTGAGGLAITPLGISAMEGENFAPLGSWHEPIALIHRRVLLLDEAMQRFPRKHLREVATRYADALPPPAVRTMSQFYNPPVVEIDVALHEGEWHFYAQDRLLGRKPLRNGEGFYLLLGEARADTGESAPELDYPISILEKLRASFVGRHDQDLIADYEEALEALVALAKQQSLIFVRRGAVTDEAMIDLLERNYKVIWHVDQEPPVSSIMKASLQELLAVLEKLEQQMTSRTGVSPYQRGTTAPGIRYATEAALLQGNTNIRIQYLAHRVAQWLNDVVEAVREYFVWLAPEEQETVTFVVDGVTHTFGVAHPYADVLEGLKVTVGNMGFQDMMTRRQELLQAMQVASIVPTRYDLGKLADALLKTYRIDATEVLANAGAGEAGEAGYAGIPASLAGQRGYDELFGELGTAE